MQKQYIYNSAPHLDLDYSNENNSQILYIAKNTDVNINLKDYIYDFENHKFTFSLDKYTLPSGLTYKNGIISGKTNSLSDGSFTITLKDSEGASITKTVTVNVVDSALIGTDEFTIITGAKDTNFKAPTTENKLTFFEIDDGNLLELIFDKGKVLVSNTPEDLIKQKNKDNLEDAFIAYIEDVLDESEKKEITLETEDKNIEKNITQNSFFSLQRALSYSYKESLELLRDKVRLTFALLGTVILLFVMGYGISFDVENLKFAVLDQDKSPISQNYIQNIAGSRYFIEKEELSSFEDLEFKMKSSQINLAFIIPPDFGKNIQKGNHQEVAVWIDGTFPFRAETIHGYVQGLHLNYLKNQYKESLGIDLKSDVNVLLRYRYNQDFKSIYSMVPAVISILLIFIPAILMALSVVREKELGSIVNFYATPVRKMEFLLGKQLPYIVVSLISFFGLVTFAIYVFQVPLKGSLFTLTLGVFLYIICTTAIGLFISSFVKTQIAALMGTAILTFLPTIQFSGLKEPVSSLEGVAQYIGNIFPVTYFINISRGVFSKNVSFSELRFEFFVLSISIFVILYCSYLVLNKQEK